LSITTILGWSLLDLLLILVNKQFVDLTRKNTCKFILKLIVILIIAIILLKILTPLVHGIERQQFRQDVRYAELSNYQRVQL
jgi:hypothetical protein